MLRIREATFEDAPAIRQLNLRNALGDVDIAVWRENWEAHPFTSEYSGVPIGWVLENVQDSGETTVVGNLDNIPMLYELGGRRIKGVVASGWAVDPEHRGKSLQLLTTFLRQKGADLTLVLSAASKTAQVLTSLKIPRIPIPDYASPCFWALRTRPFAAAALRRKSIRGASLLAWPAGLALQARDIYRRSGRGQLTAPVRRLQHFDDRFDGLWRSIGAEPGRLRAVRTRSVLQWRFRAELRTGRAIIVAAEQGPRGGFQGDLLGYAVLVPRKDSDLGMILYDLADLQAKDDDPATLRNLLLGSMQIAREEGADAMKLTTGTPPKRAAADALLPYTYRLPIWQLYYRNADPELSPALSSAGGWDISLFDTF